MDNPNMWNHTTDNTETGAYIFWGSILLTVLVLLGLMLLIIAS